MHVWGCEIPPGSRKSIRLNKASSNTLNLVPTVEFHISHPHETIHLTLIQYEGGGKQCIIQSVPKQFLLSYYNRNSWIRLKAKIPKFYLCTCSLLYGMKKNIFFGGGGWENLTFFFYLFDSPCNILHSSPTLSSG